MAIIKNVQGFLLFFIHKYICVCVGGERELIMKVYLKILRKIDREGKKFFFLDYLVHQFLSLSLSLYRYTIVSIKIRKSLNVK